MDKIIVTTIGLSVIGFIYWFFFGKKDMTFRSGGEVNIKVEGGYNPSVIQLEKGNKVIINLIRTDENSCLEEFILSDFKIKEYLPLNKKIKIEFTPLKSGEFPFRCGMNMFHGKVVVK